LDVPDYAASFVNYKGLKKLIKSLGTNGAAGGATNKATFFFRLVGSTPLLPPYRVAEGKAYVISGYLGERAGESQCLLPAEGGGGKLCLVGWWRSCGWG
jgi:hypothetical protein